MKKVCVVLLMLSLLLSGFPLFALAASYCDALPQEVLNLRDGHSEQELLDYISFQLPDGSTEGFCLDRYGWLEGYRCEDGNWIRIAQASPVDGSWSAYFVRHDTTSPRGDGSCYPNALGFDLVCSLTGNRLSYHYEGTEFVLCGWKKPSAYQGEVILKGLTAFYYPEGIMQAEASYTLGEYTNSLTMRFEDLPSVPIDGKKLASFTQEAVAACFPGYTLRSYEAYNANTIAVASYSRVEDGMLYVKRAEFGADRTLPKVTELMPVPLSDNLLRQLEADSFEKLLDIDGSSDLFQTEMAFDQEKIPVAGRIVDSDLQRDAFILLTEEDAGVRKLHIVTENDTGYDVRSTSQLPVGTRLDLFHSGDGEIYLDWSEEIAGTLRHRSAGFVRGNDGTWVLNWTMNGSGDANDYALRYCGICYEYTPGRTDGLFIGSLPNSTLPVCDLSALPASMEQVMAVVDRSGWAMVNNPTPEDRLHLRTEPDTNAASLGKFYNGTPVRIIREQDGWCQVEIGTDGRLFGWMMKKYLAFGDQMDTVRCTFPQLVLRDEHEDQPMYANMTAKVTVSVDGPLWIVGVAGENLYVIVTELGQTAYAPMEWFWEGNG